jgi:anti-sigma B factor antagonist
LRAAGFAGKKQYISVNYQHPPEECRHMSLESHDIWSIEILDNGMVRLAGEIDYTVTPQVRERLLAHIRDSEGPVVLDLGQLTYMDSSGLALLIEARRHLAEQDRSLEIGKITPEVEKIINLTQVGHLFNLQ